MKAEVNTLSEERVIKLTSIYDYLATMLLSVILTSFLLHFFTNILPVYLLDPLIIYCYMLIFFILMKKSMLGPVDDFVLEELKDLILEMGNKKYKELLNASLVKGYLTHYEFSNLVNYIVKNNSKN
jgi:hypothetical protein